MDCPEPNIMDYDDPWTQAEKFAKRFLQPMRINNISLTYKSSAPEALAADAIRQARADERKRCAAIADNYVDDSFYQHNWSVKEAREFADQIYQSVWKATEEFGINARIHVRHPFLMPPIGRTPGQKIAQKIRELT